MSEPTQQYLHSILNYEPETGLFTWKVSRGSAKKGWIAGKSDKDGYVRIGMLRKTYPAHRLVWLFVHGRWPSELIDHINGIPDDNRLCNLREASKSENGMNRKLGANNTSGHLGVIWSKHSSRWLVRVKVLGAVTDFGSYKDIELAALVASEVREKYFGEFAPSHLKTKSKGASQ